MNRKMAVKQTIVLWDKPRKVAEIGNVKKYVEENKEMLNKISPRRNWAVWIKLRKKMQAGKIGGVGKAPVKKRIETGKLNPGVKVQVPKTAPKGEIKQVKKNLTDYGKKAEAGEAKKVSEKALKKDYTIVSDNCYGVAYMKARGEPYDSPFFSMYIYAPDYIILLENFDEYMKLKPKAQEPEGKSKYKRVLAKYPVLILEGSKGPVEIHFAHEKQGAKEAIRKWTSRTSRMNMNKKKTTMGQNGRQR